MLAARTVDQLRIDPNAVAGLTHASFKDLANAELRCDRFDIGALALEAKGGISGHDFERRHFRKVGRDVLADAVAEIFLLGIATHVHEWKHADGGANLWASATEACAG